MDIRFETKEMEDIRFLKGMMERSAKRLITSSFYEKETNNPNQKTDDERFRDTLNLFNSCAERMFLIRTDIEWRN